MRIADVQYQNKPVLVLNLAWHSGTAAWDFFYTSGWFFALNFAGSTDKTWRCCFLSPHTPRYQYQCHSPSQQTSVLAIVECIRILFLTVWRAWRSHLTYPSGALRRLDAPQRVRPAPYSSRSCNLSLPFMHPRSIKKAIPYTAWTCTHIVVFRTGK